MYTVYFIKKKEQAHSAKASKKAGNKSTLRISTVHLF